MYVPPVTAHWPYHFRERFSQLLLIPLNVKHPDTGMSEALVFLTAWAVAEGSYAAYGATGGPRNNPWNTTYGPVPGSSDWNDVGVKNYIHPVEGIAANAATLARGFSPYYAQWWKDLQKGTFRADEIVERNRLGIAAWGTSADKILELIPEVRA